MPTTTSPIVLAMTGASGAPYAVRLLEVLLAAGETVYLTISPSFQAVLKQELGREIDLNNFELEKLLDDTLQKGGKGSLPTRGSGIEGAGSSAAGGSLHYCHYQDLMSSIASGSFITRGMVVCPCSGSTLGAIAHSQGTNLIHRAAEVHLKERRKLILVPRETPLSLPQIENMRAATLAGAVVLPASPGFYHGARSIEDLVDFVVSRICDQLGVENKLMNRWGTSTEN